MELPEEINIEQLGEVMEHLSPSDYLSTLDRNRPYNGQPHTDTGERGKQLISGLTMRDVRDCFVKACYHSSGLNAEEYPRSVYELPWEDMDPIAISQNLTCWIERYMGIFPNIPSLEVENGD